MRTWLPGFRTNLNCEIPETPKKNTPFSTKPFKSQKTNKEGYEHPASSPQAGPKQKKLWKPSRAAVLQLAAVGVLSSAAAIGEALDGVTVADVL